MEIKNIKNISNTSFSPSYNSGSGSFSTKAFYETSATKNTISEIIKNKSFIVQGIIKTNY